MLTEHIYIIFDLWSKLPEMEKDPTSGLSNQDGDHRLVSSIFGRIAISMRVTTRILFPYPAPLLLRDHQSNTQPETMHFIARCFPFASHRRRKATIRWHVSAPRCPLHGSMWARMMIGCRSDRLLPCPPGGNLVVLSRGNSDKPNDGAVVV